MDTSEKKIGISGGTFNPVHNGHLITAEIVREALSLDKVLFIPAGTPPHKDVSLVADAECRYHMVCEAVASNPCFEVSRIELDRKGYTYTVDTLTQLKSMYGENTQLFFIVGADIIFDLLFWRNYQRVFRLCDFAAVLRPGFDADDTIKEAMRLKMEYGARIHMIEAPQIEISSTIIRERVASGKTITYLVPENVEACIKRNGLYRGVQRKC